MSLHKQELTLTAEQINSIRQKLSELRHNVNNHLSLLTAAAEILARKPELAQKISQNLIEQPQKIVEEIKSFSDFLEKLLPFEEDK